jgi:hypothetical protein
LPYDRRPSTSPPASPISIAPCEALSTAAPATEPSRIMPWSAVISALPSTEPTIALPCRARTQRSPVESSLTLDALMRVAP